jgi:hypothetical protein|tara:strand:+ start:47 stop:241 length:195 start_codon:yes stop_codon:yes gene_type:complete
MGKVKEWATEQAQKKVDKILGHYIQGTYNFEQAKTEILKVDNLELISINEDNIDEVLLSQVKKN